MADPTGMTVSAKLSQSTPLLLVGEEAEALGVSSRYHPGLVGHDSHKSTILTKLSLSLFARCCCTDAVSISVEVRRTRLCGIVAAPTGMTVSAKLSQRTPLLLVGEEAETSGSRLGIILVWSGMTHSIAP